MKTFTASVSLEQPCLAASFCVRIEAESTESARKLVNQEIARRGYGLVWKANVYLEEVRS